MGRTIAWATLVAGTLDILFATILTPGSRRRARPTCCAIVASGPFPARDRMGHGWRLRSASLIHFALMAIMAAAFVLIARQSPCRSPHQPLKWGVIYGLITYVVMNLIVVPLRFRTPPGRPSRSAIATQLFAAHRPRRPPDRR